MQVKTFTGSTSQEVLAMVKAEMGPDAVILGNRTYRKNGEVFHEITAGLEREEQGASGSIASASGMPSGFSEWHRDWMKIKDQLFALMKPAIQLERLTPRQRIALEYLQREGVSDAVAVELYRRLLANPNSSVLECLSGMAPVKAFNAVNWPQHIQIMAGVQTCALPIWQNHNRFEICITAAQGRPSLPHCLYQCGLPTRQWQNDFETLGRTFQSYLFGSA